MSFEVLETEPGEINHPTALISYMRPVQRKPKSGSAKVYDRTGVKPQLIVTLPTSICGVGKSPSHVFMLGTGPDGKGKARIKGSAAPKAVKPKEMKHSFTWKFGYVPKFGDEIAAQERVLCRKIGDNEFEIDMPAWAP